MTELDSVRSICHDIANQYDILQARIQMLRDLDMSAQNRELCQLALFIEKNCSYYQLEHEINKLRQIRSSLIVHTDNIRTCIETITH